MHPRRRGALPDEGPPRAPWRGDRPGDPGGAAAQRDAPRRAGAHRQRALRPGVRPGLPGALRLRERRDPDLPPRQRGHPRRERDGLRDVRLRAGRAGGPEPEVVDRERGARRGGAGPPEGDRAGRQLRERSPPQERPALPRRREWRAGRVRGRARGHEHRARRREGVRRRGGPAAPRPGPGRARERAHLAPPRGAAVPEPGAGPAGDPRAPGCAPAARLAALTPGGRARRGRVLRVSHRELGRDGRRSAGRVRHPGGTGPAAGRLSRRGRPAGHVAVPRRGAAGARVDRGHAAGLDRAAHGRARAAPVRGVLPVAHRERLRRHRRDLARRQHHVRRAGGAPPAGSARGRDRRLAHRLPAPGRPGAGPRHRGAGVRDGDVAARRAARPRSRRPLAILRRRRHAAEGRQRDRRSRRQRARRHRAARGGGRRPGGAGVPPGHRELAAGRRSRRRSGGPPDLRESRVLPDAGVGGARADRRDAALCLLAGRRASQTQGAARRDAGRPYGKRQHGAHVPAQGR